MTSNVVPFSSSRDSARVETIALHGILAAHGAESLLERLRAIKIQLEKWEARPLELWRGAIAIIQELEASPFLQDHRARCALNELSKIEDDELLGSISEVVVYLHEQKGLEQPDAAQLLQNRNTARLGLYLMSRWIVVAEERINAGDDK